MNNSHVCKSVESERRDHVMDEDQLLKSLQALWFPHRANGLKVRYEMGRLLNKQLGDPPGRQQYGQGTINRVSAKLDIDKSDISRMRRFAVMSESFEEFCAGNPSMTSWTKVRCEMLQKPPRHPTDNRALWGLLRSVKTSIETLSRIEQFDGPKAGEVRSALIALFRAAQATLDIRLDEISDTDQQIDSEVAAA